MNLPFLQQRMVRILTRPPEILYALTKHWFAVGVCVSLGTIATWSLVVSGPILYEGRAQLLINPDDPIMSRLNESPTTRGPSRLQLTTFLAQQSSILRSDSVLRKLVSLSSNGNVAPPREPSGIQKKLRQLKSAISKTLMLPSTGSEKDDSGRDMQRAVEGFALRSEVIPNPEGNTVDLVVYGANTGSILAELHWWIEAYRSHLSDISRETWGDHLNRRAEKFDGAQKKAKAELDKFRDANPLVSEGRNEELTQRLLRINIDIAEIKSALHRSDFSTATELIPRDPEAARLRSQRNDMMIARERKLSEGHEKTDRAVMEFTRGIDLLNKQLGGRGSNIPLTVSPQEHILRSQQLLETLVADEAKLYGEKNKLGERLKDYQDLERRYDEAHERFVQADDLRLAAASLIDSQRMLQVQVSDKPTVDTKPVDHQPFQKLLLGAIAGLAIGIVLSIVLEILCGKVRFKQDVVDDFGLPVVAVLPR